MKIKLSSMSSIVPKAIATEAVKSAVPEATGVDVFMSKRALAFTPTAAAQSEETQLARGQRFLEVLREGLRSQADSPGALSYDVERTLTNYYPVLSTGRALAKDAGLAPGVKAFVDSLGGPRGRQLPDDLSALAAKTAGVEGVAAEAKPEASVAAPAPVGAAPGSPSLDPIAQLPLEERTITVPHYTERWTVVIQDAVTAQYTGTQDATLKTYPWKNNFGNSEDTSLVKNFGAQLSMKAQLLQSDQRYPNISSIPVEKRSLSLLDSVCNRFTVELLGEGHASVEGLPPTPIENLRAEFIEPMKKFDAFVRERIIETGPDARLPSLSDRRASAANAPFEVKTGPISSNEPSSFYPWYMGGADAFFSGGATDAMLNELNRDSSVQMQGWALDSWVTKFGMSINPTQVIEFQARRAELAAGDGAWINREAYTNLATALLRRLPGMWGNDESIPALVRYANALGLPLNEVSIQSMGMPSTLLERATALGLHRVKTATELPVADLIRPFRSADAASSEAKVNALDALRGTAATSPSFADVISGATSGFEISPITFSKLNAPQQQSVLASLTADKHVGSAAILWGLLVKGGKTVLTEALVAQGFNPEQVASWVARGQQLSTLGPAERAFATAQLRGSRSDFINFQARLELAQTHRLSQVEVAQRLAAASEPDRSTVLQNLVDWAALCGPAQQSTVKAVIDEGLRDASLTGEQVRSALSGGRAAPYLTELTSRLESAVQAVAQADVITRPGAVEALRERIEAGSQLLSREDAVLQALNSLLAQDLKYVLPLKEVDATLGGVAPKAWVEPRSARERLEDLQSGSIDASLGPEAATMPLNEAKRLYPALAHSLETLKARLVASQGNTLDLAYARQRSAELLGTFDPPRGEAPSDIQAARRALAREFEGWASQRAAEGRGP